MPLHKLRSTYEIDVYRSRPCTCSTGDPCGPCGFWETEHRLVEIDIWFDFGSPNLGWQPIWSRGYPIPDKVPRVVNSNYDLAHCETLQSPSRIMTPRQSLLPAASSARNNTFGIGYRILHIVVPLSVSNANNHNEEPIPLAAPPRVNVRFTLPGQGAPYGHPGAFRAFCPK